MSLFDFIQATPIAVETVYDRQGSAQSGEVARASITGRLQPISYREKVAHGGQSVDYTDVFYTQSDLDGLGEQDLLLIGPEKYRVIALSYYSCNGMSYTKLGLERLSGAGKLS